MVLLPRLRPVVARKETRSRNVLVICSARPEVLEKLRNRYPEWRLSLLKSSATPELPAEKSWDVPADRISWERIPQPARDELLRSDWDEVIVLHNGSRGYLEIYRIARRVAPLARMVLFESSGKETVYRTVAQGSFVEASIETMGKVTVPIKSTAAVTGLVILAVAVKCARPVAHVFRNILRPAITPTRIVDQVPTMPMIESGNPAIGAHLFLELIRPRFRGICEVSHDAEAAAGYDSMVQHATGEYGSPPKREVAILDSRSKVFRRICREFLKPPTAAGAVEVASANLEAASDLIVASASRRWRLLLAPTGVPAASVTCGIAEYVVSALLFSVRACASGGPSVPVEIRRRFREAWACRPVTRLLKYPEAVLFRGVPIENPSLEIGVADGTTSYGIWGPGRRFDAGIEFCFPLLDGFHSGARGIHARLGSAPLQALPFPSATFRTLVLVHIMDDYLGDLDEALSEIARVIAPGGMVYFSTFSDAFPWHLSRVAAARSRGEEEVRRTLRPYYSSVAPSLSAAEWRARLEKHGLVAETVRAFQPVRHSGLWERLRQLENRRVTDAGKPIALWEKLWAMPLLRSGMGALERWSMESCESGAGLNVFIGARRTGEPTREIREVSFVCPCCRGNLADSGAVLVCASCGSGFPVKGGTPILHRSLATR